MEAHVFDWMMDVFFICTLHMFYRKILGLRFQNRWVLIVGWGCCLFAWNVCGYFLAEYPLLNSLFGTIVNFLTLHILYWGSLRTKVLLIFVVVVMGIIAETIIAFTFFVLQVDVNEQRESRNHFFYLGNALSKLLWFTFVKIISHISKNRQQISVQLVDWVEILVVPVGSLIIFYIVAWDNYFSITIPKIIVFAILLLINILSYFIYQKIQRNAEELMNAELLHQQNEFYRTQCEEMERQRKNLRKIRHDMSNKYILEMSYLENGQYEELHQLYLREIGNLKNGEGIIKTGNIGVDSVVNYKLEIGRELSVRMNYEVKVGSEIILEDGELNILLGNLFDNALEAVGKLPKEKRVIDFKLCSDRTSLLFVISNTYYGTVKRDKTGKILTAKKDTGNHGIGLKNVKEIVDRHHGSMEIIAEDNRFEITVLLYMV